MGTYTPNLQFNEPTPGDPSITNSWGTILNTNAVLIDNALAGILTLSIAGSGTTILTSSAGASDQARNRLFEFTGALTGNATVLWPNGLSRFFTVWNQTTGAHTLTIGANNGSGSPAGAVAVIPQGSTAQCFSDGTNVYAQLQNGRQLVQSVEVSTSAGTAFNSSTPSQYFGVSFTPQSASSIIVLRASVTSLSFIVDGTTATLPLFSAQIYRGATALGIKGQAGSASVIGISGLDFYLFSNLPLLWQENSPGTSAVTYAVYCSDVNNTGLFNNAEGGVLQISEYL